MARLGQQEEHVKSVHILPNFSVDTEATLQFGEAPIAQGLVVCVKKSYKLGQEDSQWFHPCIARGRSVFSLAAPLSKSQLTSIDLSGSNSSIGEYTISRPDDFGCEQIENRLVVDVSDDGMLLPLYKKWIQQELTAGEVDKRWKRMNFGDTYSIIAKTEASRVNLANSVAPNCTLVMSDTVNAVLSDTENIYFTNNAVRPNTDGTVLLKSSALGGYRVYETSEKKHRFYPSNLGMAKGYYAWGQMNEQNCARIESACSWTGKLKFNTQVMKPPAILSKNIRAVEDEFSMTHQDTLAMRLSRFTGSDSIVDKLAPTDVFKLEPGPEHTNSANNYISAPIAMDHPVLNKLMNNIRSVQKAFPNFHLFNSNYMDGNRLKLPRAVYQHLAE
tara:strand:+ start:15857 stop:17017 length:1161 start_codon:yes stop_codon:yes gene_type:complete